MRRVVWALLGAVCALVALAGLAILIALIDRQGPPVAADEYDHWPDGHHPRQR